MTARRMITSALAAFAFSFNCLADDVDLYRLPAVHVVPDDRGGIEEQRVPANVQLLEREDFEALEPLSLNDLLNRRLGSVTVSDTQNNPFQPELSYRGFSVSPLLGLPQGLALYANGTRVNEAFGDTVNFDLLPTFAIQRAQLSPGANPVFGLNALGGAIALEMKDGFAFTDNVLEASGGAFGRRQASGEYGANDGRRGLYAGATHFREDGWRDASRSELTQLFSDFSFRDERLELGASVTLVESDLNGNGAAPVELLDVRRESVFTYPDNTHSQLGFLQGRLDYAFDDMRSLQATAYVRHLRRDTLNGDETDVEPCDAAPEVFCVEDDDEETLATDIDGSPIATATVGTGPYGVYNRSRTRTDSAGIALQSTHENPLADRDNHFVMGIAIDVGDTAFDNSAELGRLTPDRTVQPANVFVGGDAFNTDLVARNLYAGAYAMNVHALGETLDLSLAARFNHARIELDDRRGSALDGEHVFNRVNPAIGLAWQTTPRTTWFASYGEANRAPTPAELSCADPDEPCRFPHAFVADPPLEQVVSRTLSAGARGRLRFADDAWLRWSLAPFVAINEDDILFVSSGSLVGSGYFRNAGKTRRLGLETNAEGRHGALRWFASYTYLQATFEDAQTLVSEHHPQASADGEIVVAPGDRLPGVPRHSLSLGIGFAITPAWRVNVDATATSHRVLRGDESNQQPPVDGFGVVNLNSEYDINTIWRFFLRVENLLDTEYETFGTFGDASEVPLHELSNEASDPRFLGPGAPRSAWLGLRLRLR